MLLLGKCGQFGVVGLAFGGLVLPGHGQLGRQLGGDQSGVFLGVFFAVDEEGVRWAWDLFGHGSVGRGRCLGLCVAHGVGVGLSGAKEMKAGGGGE